MFAYVGMHLLNHAAGLFSLAVAEAGLRVSILVWQSGPGTVALYGAFTVHFGLALRTIYQRRHWRLPFVEWVRLWSGFSLPLLLVGHAVNTRIAASFYGFEPSYGTIVSSLVHAGAQGWQIALLAPGWLHGCLGLWITLKQFSLMRRLRWGLAVTVVALPGLAASGFLAMSREVAMSRAPGAPDARTTSADADALRRWREGLVATYVAMLVAAFSAGRLRERRFPQDDGDRQ